jgi:hypothetical protein
MGSISEQTDPRSLISGSFPTEAEEVAQTLAVLHNAVTCWTWNHYEIAADRAPTDEQRALLERRGMIIREGLKPADYRAAISAIMDLMHGFQGADGMSPKDMVAKAEVYLAGVRNEPLWAIRRACKAWRDGEHGQTDFMPSTARFVPTVKDETTRARQELSRIDRVLTARVVQDVDPAVRARLADWAAEVIAEIAAQHGNDADRRAKWTPRGLDELLAEAHPHLTAEERAHVRANLTSARPREANA